MVLTKNIRWFLSLSLFLTSQYVLSEPIIKVTLLGTGVPLLNAVGYNFSGRVMSATLVEVREATL